MPTDLYKGIWPAGWTAKCPELAKMIQQKFDILEVCGSRKNYLAIDSDRFIVVYERAGPNAINWTGARTLKNEPFILSFLLSLKQNPLLLVKQSQSKPFQE
jgi:hypothetical protein